MGNINRDKSYTLDSLVSACDAIVKFYGVLDEEIVLFAVNTITEKDGFSDGYAEVLELAEKKFHNKSLLNI